MTTPALGDLPAHVARYHTQQAIGHSADLARYYVYEWRFLPNMGVDLAVAVLGPLLGVEPATQLVVACLPALVVLALLLIARDVHGRIPWTTLFALPLAFAYPFIFGFVNYWLSVGLALMGLFICLRLTRAGRPLLRSAVLALLSPLVLISHMAGFGILGILCFGALFGEALEKKEPPVPAFLRACLACLPLAWPAVLLVIWREPDAGLTGHWFEFRTLFTWTGTMLRTRWMAVDIASALLVCVIPLLPLVARKRASWSLPLLIPAIMLAICAALLPRQINGSDFASVRLIPVAVAIAILSVRPLDGQWRLGAWLGLAFFGGRVALLLATMIGVSSTARRELAGLDHIARGARVAAFHITPCGPFWEPRYLIHLQAMVATRRDAMVNDGFVTVPGQLARLSAAERARPRLPSNDTRAPVCRRADTVEFAKAYGEVDLRSIDYIWIIDTVGLAWPKDPRLQKVWSDGHSVIFAVRH